MYKLRWMFFSASEVRIVSLNYMYLYFALNDKPNMITCISNKTCLKFLSVSFVLCLVSAARGESLLKIMLIYVSVVPTAWLMLLNYT